MRTASGHGLTMTGRPCWVQSSWWSVVNGSGSRRIPQTQPEREVQLGRGDALQSGDHAQDRGLPARRRPGEHQELPCATERVILRTAYASRPGVSCSLLAGRWLCSRRSALSRGLDGAIHSLSGWCVEQPGPPSPIEGGPGSSAEVRSCAERRFPAGGRSPPGPVSQTRSQTAVSPGRRPSASSCSLASNSSVWAGSSAGCS